MALVTDPIDLLLDPVTGDLVVTTDLQFSSGVSGVVQAVSIRLNQFKGEWFADLDLGVPWFQEILGQKPNAPQIRTQIRQAILDTPGIVEVTSLEIFFEGVTRNLTIEWRARTEFGDTPPVTELIA